MNMQRIRLGVFFWLLAAVPIENVLAQVTAPADPMEPAAELRRYTVEIIVFEYADSDYAGDEVFLPDISEPPVEQEEDNEFVFTDSPTLPPAARPGDKPTLNEIPVLRQLDMTVLPAEQFTMQDIYAKLERLDAYKPIVHSAWTQTTFEKDSSAPLRLRMLGSVPLRLDGDLTLYLSRYLHLVVNLALDAKLPSPLVGSLPAAESGFGNRMIYSDKPDLRPSPVRYRIFEDRIFKSGDIRYFDHPKFGVLAKVTRREPEERPSSPMLSDAQIQ
jgi:hypothetical protein